MSKLWLLVGMIVCATQAVGYELPRESRADGSLVVTAVGVPVKTAAGEIWVAASPGGALVYANWKAYEGAAGTSYSESDFGNVLRVGDDLAPSLVPYSPDLLASPPLHSVCGKANQVIQLSDTAVWATPNGDVSEWPEYVFDATNQCPIFRFTCDAQYCEVHRVRNGVTEKIYKGYCKTVSLGCMCWAPELT
jgi:hypothetical protein